MPMEKPKQSKSSLQKPIAQDLTEGSTGFSPTKKMVKWFDTTAELGFSASFSEIADQSKVSRGSWYVWTRDPNFVKWWDEQWQQRLHQNRWKLDEIGMKMAKKSYSYWKDMMNRTGNTIPEAGNQIQVNQQFNLPDANLERITREN